MENEKDTTKSTPSGSLDTLMPTRWDKIKRLILRYHEKMNHVSNCLIAESPTLRMNKDYEALNFSIDKDALKRIDIIRRLPNFDKLLVFFGTDEDELDSNTIIVLGADASGRILAEHKDDNPQGEETWPDDDGTFILRSTRDELEDFLT